NHFKNQNLDVPYQHSLKNIKPTTNPPCQLTLKNLTTPPTQPHTPKFLFIPPPPPTFHLLHKTPIPQPKHIPAFPLTPLFILSKNPHILNHHHPKLYPN
ncbi:malate:quinone oxidoreductase, partial [Paenibacillus xylanexedens]|uniref:malate:quinone oxidoreductase n=1 Tax=Paenibacillus xylanexedens TaxID=528191 RepID=UPI001643022A